MGDANNSGLRKAPLTHEEYLELVEQAPILIWRSDTSGACDYFNERWLGFRGRTMEQEVGNGWAEGVHADDMERCLEIYLRNFQARQSFEMEYRLQRFDGEYRWIFDRGVPFYDTAGQFLGYVGSCVDVTGRIAGEAALRESHVLKLGKEAAERANRQKTAFLANVSHEIRTPMNGVVGMADLLAATELNGEQRDYLDVIRDSAGALLRIVNEVLDISKIEAGKLDLDDCDFDLAREVRSITTLLGALAAQKRVRLEVSIGADVPTFLYGDRGRLRQILINLASNALKFSPAEGSVRISIEVRGGDLRFEVFDRGIGLAEEAIARLFQPFAQATSGTHSMYGGTGLGLAISKMLVELMGGQIGVTSELGAGSAFWFRIPLRPGSEDRIPAPAPGNGAVSTCQPSGGRILVVDDHRVNQRVMTGMLGKLGYSFAVASTGKEALDACEKETFAVVLMDCFMPEMDGIQATGRIRNLGEERGSVPVIGVTASVSLEVLQACKEAGMNEILHKPLQLQRLADVLARWNG